MAESIPVPQFVGLPIEWNIPNDIVPRYATHMVVQRMEHEFLISFFEIRPPIILGKPDEVATELEKIKSVHANCIAQIMVSIEKMPEIVNTLEQVEKLSVVQMDESKVKE